MVVITTNLISTVPIATTTRSRSSKIMLKQIGDVLFPSVCPSCQKHARPSEQLLCADCHAALEPNEAACPHCAAPLLDDSDHNCRSCHGRGFPGIHRCFAPFTYSPILQNLVVAAKVQARRSAHLTLRQYICSLEASLRTLEFDALCVIPRSPGRRYGPHLATGLAQSLADCLHKPLLKVLQQHRLPAAQHELPAHMRQKNTRDLFSIKSQQLPQRVLIVDDLITSGHTMIAAASCLHQHGVKRIYACAVARSSYR